VAPSEGAVARETDNAVTPKEGTTPLASSAGEPPAKRESPIPAWPQGRDRGPAVGALTSDHAVRAAQSRVEAGSCAPFCQKGYSSGLDGGPAAGLSAAWFALQPRAFKLAAPGVGRLLDQAPALGRPVDIAPFERPG
jgi:hypothetical protein